MDSNHNNQNEHNYENHHQSHTYSHSHKHFHNEEHSHTHGVIDPTITSSEKGIWAVKWSFNGLFITALIQVTVVYFSGSIALLASCSNIQNQDREGNKQRCAGS